MRTPRMTRARICSGRSRIPLCGRLADASREVRAAALETLGQLGDERAASAIIRLLADSAEDVRAQAVQSLGNLGTRAAVPALIELLQHGSDALRGRAA